MGRTEPAGCRGLTKGFMTTTHTPGPWSFGAHECPDNAAALAICKATVDATETSSGQFFEVFLDDGLRTALVGHGPNGAANARLIAAAPCLLIALRALLASNVEPAGMHAEMSQDEMSDLFAEVESRVDAAVLLARQAIADATGVPA